MATENFIVSAPSRWREVVQASADPPSSQPVLFSLVYGGACNALHLGVLRLRAVEEKDIEILMLRHQLAVLRRQSLGVGAENAIHRL